ncbi:MAG: MATE family efflux transporter [Treponema sp.]|nr:MATE family efflux transporter [Treponema sp.]
MKERWNNRALFSLLWPLVVEQLLAMTMGVAATVMVSPVGEFAVSGVNVIDNINNLFIITFIALSTGGAVVVSQYIGRGDAPNAGLASRQLVYIVIIASLVIAAVALLFREPVIRGIYGSLQDDVMDAAMTFFLFSALSYPALALYSVCAALFRSTGDSQSPMRVSILMNILHIAGNAFFLHWLHMGVQGVALSMLVSRILAAALIFFMLVKNSTLPVSLSGILNFKLVPSMIRQVLNIGVPTGLEQSMFMFGRLLTQRIFPYFGTGMIAANAVASVSISVSFMAGTAFGMALLTVVGQCMGAGDIEAAKRETAKILKIAWVAVFITSGLTFIFRDVLTGLFNLSPDAQEAANLFLAVHSVTMLVGWTLSFTLPNALRAAGDVRYVMLVAFISMWAIRVTAAYLLSFTFGIGPLGVWIAMAGDFLVRGICYLHRWRSGRWQRMKVIDR